MVSIDNLVEKASVLDEREPVSKAIALLKDKSKPANIVVSSGGKYYGVIDDRTLQNFMDDAEVTKCLRVAKQAPKLAPTSSVDEIVSDFLNSDSKILPLIDGDEIVGVVTRKGALRLLLSSQAIKGRRVSELMTSPAVTVPESATIAQARAAMRSSKLHRLVVVDKHGRISGLVSTYDISVRVKPYEKKKFRDATFRPSNALGVEQEPVSSVMTPEVLTIHKDASVGEAVEKMLANNVAALAVEESGKPTGVLSERDVFGACVSVPPEPVTISGLDEKDSMLKTAIYDECAAFVERLKKSFDVGFLTVTFKKASEGGFRHRYQVRARVFVNAHAYSAKEPEQSGHRELWDAHLAVKEVLGELRKIVEKNERRDNYVGKPFEFHRVRG
jgi:CBS domain-containing protein